MRLLAVMSQSMTLPFYSHRRFTFMALLTATVISFSLSGCGGDKAGSNEETTESGTTATESASAKSLVYVVSEDPRDLNPVVSTNLYNGEVNALIFDTLVS